MSDLQIGDIVRTPKGEFVVVHAGELEYEFDNGERATKSEVHGKIMRGKADVKRGGVAL